jgi:very-short-patch-repair endonuclease
MMNNLPQNGVGEENITNETKNKSTKNECESITKVRKYLTKTIDGKRVWYKDCPICHREQRYSSIRAIYHAMKGNSHCLCCKNSGSGNPFFGKHHEDEHKKKLSEIQLKTCSYRYKKIGKNPDKIKKNCLLCDDEFYVVNSKQRRKYCCYECAINDNFGFDPLKKTEPEKKFEAWLQINNVDYKSPYPLKGKLYDFYIPSENMLVEIDGIYWHGRGLVYEELNETQKLNRLNDNKKTCIARENGYNLLRIWEDEIKDKNCTKIFI